MLGGELVTRVAAIDCGTNSIRLLIAEPNGSGGLRDLDRRLEIVRLGQGVDASGEFHADALQRTFAVVDQYAELIKKADVPVANVHFVATSAARDARNRDSFFAGIKQRLGVLPDVISGATEAHLSFVDALLADSGVDFASIGTWIGVAGTATTLAGVYLELEHYDREQVHGAVIPL